MSEKKNNRPLEIKSLKGPRRKLQLEVIDGKRYVKTKEIKLCLKKYLSKVLNL